MQSPRNYRHTESTTNAPDDPNHGQKWEQTRISSTLNNLFSVAFRQRVDGLRTEKMPISKAVFVSKNMLDQIAHHQRALLWVYVPHVHALVRRLLNQDNVHGEIASSTVRSRAKGQRDEISPVFVLIYFFFCLGGVSLFFLVCVMCGFVWQKVLSTEV